MRPRLVRLAAVSTGLAAALLLVATVALGILAPGPASVVVPAGSTEFVPPFQHLANASNFVCTSPRCGSPGEHWIDFTVYWDARLSGSLSTSAPVDVWLGNAAGMSAACSLSDPPPPCASAVGPAYLYESPTEITSLDLGNLQFNSAGNGKTLPAGGWTLLLINWSDAPVSVTVDSSIVVSPVW